MDLFTREDLKDIMEFRAFPSLSFYLPAHRMGTETRQSATRLKNLLKQAEDLLHERGLRTAQIRTLLEPVAELVENAIFWEYRDNGLALFLHADGLRSFQLPFAVEESVTVSDRFRIRPLIPLVNGDGMFHLLTISLSESRLYDCTRRTLVERKVPGLPASLKEILSTYEDERVYQHHTSAAKTGGAAKGFNPIKELDKARIEEYLREVDLAVGRQIARDRAPLVLVCVDYLLPMFRNVSKYGPLMERNVSGSPDTLKPDRMLSEAWEIVRPLFEKSRTRAFAQWEAMSGTSRVLEGILRILPAAAQGRVETLFLVDGQSAPGTFDPVTEKVDPASEEREDAVSDDLYELAAAYVFHQGGDVFLTEEAEMPAGVGCAALLRY